MACWTRARQGAGHARMAGGRAGARRHQRIATGSGGFARNRGAVQRAVYRRQDSLNDECLGYLHGRPMPGQLRANGAQRVHCPFVVIRPASLSESFALLQDDVALVPVTEGALGLRAGDARRRGRTCRIPSRTSAARVLALAAVAARRPAGAAAIRLQFCAAAPCDELRAHFSGTLLRSRARAWFDADAFKQPVRRDRDALQSFLRATPGNVVGPHLNERSASARVRMVLQRPAPNGPTWPSPRSARTCR